MFTNANPITRDLGHGLILKSVSTSDDVKRLGAFNLHIHGEGLDTMTSHLINHHPHTHPDEWWFVEDTANGKIVSSLCLIPWTWCYAGVELRTGEMGIVGTLEEYRRRGLIRALVQEHKNLLNTGEFHLSHIQGIPYYYRQFGYEYAIPLEGGLEIEPYRIPDELPESARAFSFRMATVDDIPTLRRMYDENACDLDIYAERSEGAWEYLLTYSTETEMVAEFWLVLDAENQPVGYWCIQLYGFGTGLNISEASPLSHPATMAVLGKSKQLATEREKPYIRLYIQPEHTLNKTAQAWGGMEKGRYAWQMNIPNMGRLLRQIAPVLESRIASSALAGMTDTITLNFYREAYDLRFEGGKLIAVEGPSCKAGGPIQIPPLLFAPLVLGYRNREELAAIYPDFSVWGQSRIVIDVLFPKMRSYIYTMY